MSANASELSEAFFLYKLLVQTMNQREIPFMRLDWYNDNDKS